MTLLLNHPRSPLGGLGRSLEERSKSPPCPAPAWENGSKRPRGLCTPCWQLAHSVTHTQHLLSSKDCAPRRVRLKVSTLLEGSILLLSPQQGCTELGLAVGGCWAPDTPFVVFKATGRKKNPGSGIHVVPEHPRQFSPRQQALLVLRGRWETGAQSNGYQLRKAEARDSAEIRLQKFLSKTRILFSPFCYLC